MLQKKVKIFLLKHQKKYLKNLRNQIKYQKPKPLNPLKKKSVDVWKDTKAGTKDINETTKKLMEGHKVFEEMQKMNECDEGVEALIKATEATVKKIKKNKLKK